MVSPVKCFACLAVIAFMSCQHFLWKFLLRSTIGPQKPKFWNTFNKKSKMSRMRKTKWYDCEDDNNIDELLSILEEGDLLEFQRTGYRHWALYIGYKKVSNYVGNCDPPAVIHRCVPTTETRSTLLRLSASTSSPQMNSIGVIEVASFKDVVKTQVVRINNELDKKWAPFDINEIIARAEEHIGKEKKYNVVTSNCEHFVNLCRYGITYSRQAKTFFVDAGISGAFTLAGIIARVAWLFSPIILPPPISAVLVSVGVATSLSPWMVRGGKALKDKLKKC